MNLEKKYWAWQTTRINTILRHIIYSTPQQHTQYSIVTSIFPWHGKTFQPLPPHMTWRCFIQVGHYWTPVWLGMWLTTPVFHTDCHSNEIPDGTKCSTKIPKKVFVSPQEWSTYFATYFLSTWFAYSDALYINCHLAVEVWNVIPHTGWL